MTIVPVQKEGASPALTVHAGFLALDEAKLFETDPLVEAQMASALLKLIERLASIVSERRRLAVLHLVHEQRMPKASVARHIGVSPTRINQVLKARPLTAVEVTG